MSCLSSTLEVLKFRGSLSQPNPIYPVLEGQANWPVLYSAQGWRWRCAIE